MRVWKMWAMVIPRLKPDVFYLREHAVYYAKQFNGEVITVEVRELKPRRRAGK